MPNSLKSTLEYFAGKPNLASQVKLQKLDKAGVLRNGNKDITFHTIFYTMTNKGVMRWSLLTILPFVVLAIISSQVRMTQSSEVSLCNTSFKIIDFQSVEFLNFFLFIIL